MDELKTLIRLAQHNLDEKRKALAELEGDVARVEGEKAALLAMLARELEGGQGVLEGKLTQGAFIRATYAKRDAFDLHLQELESLVEAMREEVRYAFEVLKRYEVAADQRAKAARREALRRETKKLDEMGSEVTRRRKAGGDEES